MAADFNGSASGSVLPANDKDPLLTPLAEAAGTGRLTLLRIGNPAVDPLMYPGG